MINLLRKFLTQNKMNLLLILLGVVISVFGVSHWFSGNSYLNFVDALVPVDVNNSFLRLFYNFDSHVFPWNTETNWSWALYWIILSALHLLFRSLSLAQELLYIALLSFSIINFYFLANNLFRKFIDKPDLKIIRITSFVFALFYTFNLYTFYYGFFMFNPDAFIIAFLPLNMLALFNLFNLDKEKVKMNKLWIIVFFITLIFMTPGFITYIFLAQYLAWLVLYLVIYMFLLRENYLRQTVSLVVFFILVLLSQWWWFLPALLGFSDLYEFQSSTGILSWFNGGFLPSQLLNSFRLLGIPLMFGNPFSWSNFYTENKFFTFPLFLFPFLLLFFVYKLKEVVHKNTFVYLLIMLLVSLFIVKFSNPPGVFISRFAYEHIPFFGAFRDSYHKAGVYFLFPFMTISSLGAGIIMQKIFKNKNKSLFAIFVLVLVIAGVVITGPFFIFKKDNIRNYIFYSNNKKYAISAKTKIPSEYYQLKKEFESNCHGKVVLVVPRGAWISNAVWPKYNSSYMSLDLLSQIINCSFIDTIVFKTKSEAVVEAPYVLLQNNQYRDFKQFLYKNQIQFILIRHDNVANSFANWFYINPSEITTKLDKDPDFKKKNINNYFDVYEFKKLNFPNTFGFALSENVIYTNSPLSNSIDNIAVSNLSPNVIGPVILNTKKDLGLFKNYVSRYVAEGLCDNCRKKDEIGRLTSGTLGKIKFKLDVEKNGTYNCYAHIYAPGSEVSDVLVTDKKNKAISVNSQPIFLSRGTYVAIVSYNLQQFINKKSMSIKLGDIIELSVPRLTDRNYRLRYEVQNPDLSLEIILAKKRLSKTELDRKQINPDDVVFVNPVGPSNTLQINDRILQLDEFNIKSYHLYIRALKDNLPNHRAAIIKNLILERTIDTNYISFACGFQAGSDSSNFTTQLKVSENNPLEYKILLPKKFKKGFLTFNKNYAPSWEAYEIQNGKKYIFPHIQSGHANAWYVENANNREIFIINKKQKLAEKNAIVTFIIFTAVFILYFKFKKNE